jgi:sialidase-1
MDFKKENLFLGDGYDCYRIPSIIATNRGTVIAFCNSRIGTYEDHADTSTLVMRRKEAGGNWEDIVTLSGYPEWSMMIGSAVYDPVTDKIMCLYKKKAISQNEFAKKLADEEYEAAVEKKEKRDGTSQGDYIVESIDDGKTWTERMVSIEPNSLGLIGFSHGSSPGIILKSEKYRGRLLCPARCELHPYSTWEEAKTACVNTVLISDDHGMTWRTGGIVQPGTGEGTLAELYDGTIYYNSRAMFNDNKRYTAYSYDGGFTFENFGTASTLIEPIKGCNASLLRIEKDDDSSVMLFANPRHKTKRVDMTICVSMDEGQSWKVCKKISSQFAAYSSMCYSEVTKLVTLFYECGDKWPYNGLDVVEFGLEELLDACK